MIPISACAKNPSEEFYLLIGLVIIQNRGSSSGDADSLPTGAQRTKSGYFPAATAPNISCSRLSDRRLIQTLGNQHRVAFDVNDDRPALRQPRVLAGQCPMYPADCGVLLSSALVHMQISLGQRLGIDRGKLRRLSAFDQRET